MKSDRRIKLGVIGLGNHAQENLLPALQMVEGIELYAVQTRDKKRANQIAQRYNVPNVHATSDLTTLIRDAACDGIIVSATPQVHEQALLAAVKAGKPVFVEKPPASNFASFKGIVDTVHAARKAPIVQFGFNFRHSDFYSQIEAMAATRQIRTMKIRSYAAKPDAPMWDYEGIVASSLYAVHIHAIEMLCYTLGPVSGFEQALTWLNDKKFLLTITVSFADGKTGILELSNASNRFEFAVECMDANANVLRCVDFNHFEVFGPDFDAQGLFQPKSFVAYDTPFLRGGYGRTGYSRQFEAFRDAIKADKLDARSLNSCLDTYKIILGVKDRE